VDSGGFSASVWAQEPGYLITVIPPGKGSYQFPQGYQTPWGHLPGIPQNTGVVPSHDNQCTLEELDVMIATGYSQAPTYLGFTLPMWSLVS